jgi:hypothetical protein
MDLMWLKAKGNNEELEVKSLDVAQSSYSGHMAQMQSAASQNGVGQKKTFCV